VDVCEVFGLKVDLPPGVTEEGIIIYEGWNLIAIPGFPHFGPYTVRQFIKDVEYVWDGTLYLTAPDETAVTADSDFEYVDPLLLGPQWKVTRVAVYKGGQFKNLPPEGYSYNMVPGEAYFVHARYNEPWPGAPLAIDQDGNIIGEVWKPMKKVNIAVRKLPYISYLLNRGWNGMSMGAIGEVLSDGTKLVTCSSLRQLSKELEKQGIKATKVAFWLQDSQEWVVENLPMEEYILTNPFDLPPVYDRIIRADEGFFLFCDENGLFFLPGIDTYVPRPPLPPFPSERVSYTGKVYPVMVRCFGPPPPYSFALGLDNGEQVYLTPGNEEASEQLKDAAGDEKYYTVEGAMKTMMSYNNRPEGAPGTPVDVLMVDKALNHDGGDIIRLEINVVEEAKKDLCAKFFIDVSEITDSHYIIKEAWKTNDYPSSHRCEIYLIGLAYNNETHLYDAKCDTVSQNQFEPPVITIEVTYKGTIPVEYDAKGNLILQ